MTEVVAKLRYLRISPKKVRQVTALLKGLSFKAAEAQLRFLPQKSVKPLLKLLASAGANAVQNYKLRKEDLMLSKILVDPGPILKRSMPRAHGRAFPINKRTSHVSFFLQPIKSQ